MLSRYWNIFRTFEIFKLLKYHKERYRKERYTESVFLWNFLKDHMDLKDHMEKSHKFRNFSNRGKIISIRWMINWQMYVPYRVPCRQCLIGIPLYGLGWKTFFVAFLGQIIALGNTNFVAFPKKYHALGKAHFLAFSYGISILYGGYFEFLDPCPLWPFFV